MTTTSPPKNNRMSDHQRLLFGPTPRKLVACLFVLSWLLAPASARVSASPPAQAQAGDRGVSRAASPQEELQAGKAAPESSDQASKNAERLVDEAISQVAGLDSVSADLLQTVDMLNQTFTIKGRFFKAPGSRIYLELTAAGAGVTNARTLHVCDGSTLWDLQEIVESRTFTRLSIQPILERLAAPDLEPKVRETTLAQIGFAGVDSLLAGLRSFYKFTGVDAEPSLVDDRPVWVLHGTWKSSRGLLAVDARADSTPRFLPPYIPGEATVYLGKADHWPYKVVLAGSQPAVPMDTRRRGQNGEPIGARSSIIKLEPTRMVLTYSNVVPHATIPADRFQAPTLAGIQAHDRTPSMIDALDQAPRIPLGKTKSEPTREADPLPGAPIEIELPAVPEFRGPR